MSESNHKTLLCYNTIKNKPCTYKSKCLFAHNLDEQQKDFYRDIVYNMITNYEDLSDINIHEDNELLNNLVTYTHECKNCINNQCAGGYNCKYGACLKSLKICYNDLIYGKCSNCVNDNKCMCGHHLTEKKLIPLSQYRLLKDINVKDMTNNVDKISLFKTCSMVELNDQNIKNIKNILNFNN